MKENTGKFDFIKIKNFCLQNTLKSMIDKPQTMADSRTRAGNTQNESGSGSSSGARK